MSHLDLCEWQMQHGLWWPWKPQLTLAVGTAGPEPASLLSLRICDELPLAWNTKKAQQLWSHPLLCSETQVSGVSGPSPPQAFSWMRSSEPGHCLRWEVWITNHTLQEQKASLFLCTSLTFFLVVVVRQIVAECHFETDTRSCALGPPLTSESLSACVLMPPVMLRSLHAVLFASETRILKPRKMQNPVVWQTEFSTI